MARPKKKRSIGHPPKWYRFKPAGIPRNCLEQTVLTIDEYEAIHLADYLGLEHKEAAEKMEISRSTFTRLIEKSRRKMSELIIEGKELVIEGGNIGFRGNLFKCKKCGFFVRTDINENVTACPNCKSTDLEDLGSKISGKRCCQRNR